MASSPDGHLGQGKQVKKVCRCETYVSVFDWREFVTVGVRDLFGDASRSEFNFSMKNIQNKLHKLNQTVHM